jgi:hypothetical protein
MGEHFTSMATSLDKIMPLALLVPFRDTTSGTTGSWRYIARVLMTRISIKARSKSKRLPTHNSQPAACSMPSPHTSVQNTDFVESKTEPESETESESEIEVTDPESDPDNEYSAVIENQLGLPEYQYGIIESSPPPVDANADDLNNKGEANADDLNNKGEFFSRRGLQKLTFRLAKTGYRAQVSADDGNDSGAMNTDVVVLLGDKVRRTSFLWCRSTKSSQKKTKIEVHVEGSYRSNPTININIKQAHFRGKKHERQIEGVEGTTEIHVQVKKTRK